MSKKILITDRVHPCLLSRLQSDGYLIEYIPKMSYVEVKQAAGDYHGIIINSKVRCDRAFLQSHKHLEFIARLGVGLDIIDLEVAEELGIPIIYTPGANANAVAEHTIGMTLALRHHIIRANWDVKSWNWVREANRGHELKNATIGIIGMGNTGGLVATKLQTWNMSIIGYDKYKKDIESQYPFVRSVSLDDLIAQSDIISLHIPLTDETRHLVDTQFLSKMKAESLLINTARGGIIDTPALVEALQEKRIAGAALDVLENEKLDTLPTTQKTMYQKLFDMDNVILTPHIAGWSHQSLRNIADMIYQRITALYENQ